MPDLSYLGKVIYEARTKAGITSSKLCYGLCSVSMLSRIESGERTPGVLLFTALLQRAGGSVTDLVFLCSKREATIYSIITGARGYSADTAEKYKKVYAEYSAIADLSNNIELQYYYYFQSKIETDPNKQFDFYMKALECTLPNVGLENISSYPLSSAERDIVSRVLSHYVHTKNTRIAAKIYEDLAYLQERNPADIRTIKSSFLDRYGVLLCNLVDGDIDEVLHLAKRFFKKYDPNTFPDMEVAVSKYRYQLGYAKLYTDEDSSGIDVVTAYYMNRLLNNYKHAEVVREDARIDLGYEFEIEFM